MKSIVVLLMVFLVFTGCNRMTAKEMREKIEECTELKFGYAVYKSRWTLEQDNISCCVPTVEQDICNTERL